MLILFIVWVFTAVVSAEKFNEKVIKDDHPIDVNAKGLYDPTNQRCCNGFVYPGSQNTAAQCCGKNMYDKSTQLCCDGAVHDMQIGSLCCGNETYNTKTAMCCSKIVAPFKNGVRAEHARCCQRKAYDPNTQLCCHFNDIAILTKQSKTDDACCGNFTYNTTKEVCCREDRANPESKVVPKDGDKENCCGGKLYGDTEDCCDGEVVTTSDHTSCCGKKAYNFEKQLCCSNRNGTLTVVDKTSPAQDCCGQEMYDNNKQVCCYGKLYDHQDGKDCCGSELYDPKTHLCCQDKLFDNKDGQGDCCAGEKINVQTQLCCNGAGKLVGVLKHGPNDNQCCRTGTYNVEAYDDGTAGTFVTYDDKTSMCCNHDFTVKVVDKTSPEDDLCCGFKTYKYGKDICCEFASMNGIQLNYGPPDDDDGDAFYNRKCCGETAFNSTGKELCCNGNLYVKNGTWNHCCGDSVYNHDKEVCCGENVYKKKGDNYQCCHHSITDEDQDVLTKGFVDWVQKVKTTLKEILESFGGKTT